MSACNDIRLSSINVRALKIALMLIRAMDVTTVNNEVCVGSLICYLKDLYVSKQENSGPFDPNSRGFELLSEAMKAGELR